MKCIKCKYKETFIVLDLGFKGKEKIIINKGVWHACSL